MNVREVRRRPRKVSVPSEAAIIAIRKTITVQRVTLQTGSIWLLLGGEEFRLQKVNKGPKDRFCFAFEPRRCTLAEKIALLDEAFERFEDARDNKAKSKGSVEKEPERPAGESKGQLMLFPQTA